MCVASSMQYQTAGGRTPSWQNKVGGDLRIQETRNDGKEIQESALYRVVVKNEG